MIDYDRSPTAFCTFLECLVIDLIDCSSVVIGHGHADWIADVTLYRQQTTGLLLHSDYINNSSDECCFVSENNYIDAPERPTNNMRLQDNLKSVRCAWRQWLPLLRTSLQGLTTKVTLPKSCILQDIELNILWTAIKQPQWKTLQKDQKRFCPIFPNNRLDILSWNVVLGKAYSYMLPRTLENQIFLGSHAATVTRLCPACIFILLMWAWQGVPKSTKPNQKVLRSSKSGSCVLLVWGWWEVTKSKK